MNSFSRAHHHLPRPPLAPRCLLWKPSLLPLKVAVAAGPESHGRCSVVQAGHQTVMRAVHGVPPPQHPSPWLHCYGADPSAGVQVAPRQLLQNRHHRCHRQTWACWPALLPWRLTEQHHPSASTGAASTVSQIMQE